jgi:hypothetical protein
MMYLAVAALAFSAPQHTRLTRSSVSMSAASDLKLGFATLAAASVLSVLPAATEAITYELPTMQAVALKPNVKIVDLGDEPNKLKVGFRGLGLTTGIRAKKDKPVAVAFKPPASAKIFKGTISAIGGK